jgi:hypothetical protein
VVKPFTVIVIALHVANRPCTSTVAVWVARAQQKTGGGDNVIDE